MAGEQGACAEDRRICKTGLGQKREHMVFCILGEAMMRMQAGRCPIRGWRDEIDQMKTPAWFQDPPDFAQGPALFVAFEVVKHNGGEHAIERCVEIRQRVSKAAIEMNHSPRSPRLAFTLCKRS